MEKDASDTFALENSGTARFVGNDPSMCKEAGGGASSSCSAGGTTNASHEFQTMKPGLGQKNEVSGRAANIPHSELVKMLYYLEGELQARDVVIAVLRNERLKHFLNDMRTKRVQPTDPYAAIFRDKVIMGGSLVSRDASTQAAQAELEVRQIIEQQMEQQYQMVNKQRATHLRMVSILKESLENNQRMLQELEEEKRKNENDAAQGDDITYSLEIERTKLRQELEEERAQVQKMEKDLKKLQETLDFERNRQKQIVLLLIAERKKILMKYIEEGKRSEDLAQILTEEKQRSDTIAEGLEEESKKSLRMEEDLEKQAAAFENERKTLKANLAKEEKRVKELEQELALLRNENETLKVQQQQLQLQQQQQQLQQANTGVINVTSGTVGKPRVFNEEVSASSMVNIAKIVQPTATVSSVPVSGPTTGIARSIVPGQSIRSGITNNAITATTANASDATTAPSAAQLNMPPAPSPAKMQPTATIQRAPGGVKYSALAAAHSLDQTSTHAVPIAVPPVTVPPAGARGVPPPIPPNKPIVPPKREPSLSRLGTMTAAAAAAAAASIVSGAAASSNNPQNNVVANINAKLN